MRASSTPHSSYGASRPMIGVSEIESMCSPSFESARARHERPVSSS